MRHDTNHTQVNLLRARRDCGTGFTLIEIMIVVGIIALLAALALPGFQTVRESSRASRLANDWRLFEYVFQTHATDEGEWAEDGFPGTTPSGMAGYLDGTPWSQTAPTGGNWDWEFQTVGVTAGISLVGSDGTASMFERVDRILDDGNLGAGRFQGNGDRFTLILEP